VPQDPGHALNPVRTVGAQAKEVGALSKDQVLETFAQVGLDDPRRVYDSYPHELSGGMLQRVLIGLTVLPRPALIVADEPTSALDVTVQLDVLKIMDKLVSERGMGLIVSFHPFVIVSLSCMPARSSKSWRHRN
jgi:peptide/nickel transport system ATP-binding protein